MAVKVDVLQAAANTVAGTQDFTISGFGTPKAYLIFMTQATVNGTPADHAVIGIGGGDGTREFALTNRMRHNLATSDCDRWAAADESIQMLAPDALSINGEAHFDSFITDGVRLNWGVAPDTAFLMHVMLFGGSDLSAYVGSNVTHNGAEDAEMLFTDAGFRPSTVFFTTHGQAFTDAGVANSLLSFGFSADTTPIRQFTNALLERNGQGTTKNGGMAVDNRCCIELAVGTQNTINNSIEMTSYQSTGFGVTKRDLGHGFEFSYLALNFNGALDSDVRIFDSPTTAGLFSRSAFGWPPQVVMLLPTFFPTINVGENSEPNGAGVFSINLLGETNQYSVEIASRDAVSTSDTRSLVDNQAVNFVRGDGSVVFDATLTSFDGAGYTLNFGSADGTARQWAEWAVQAAGDEVNLDPVVLSLTVPPVTLQEELSLAPVVIGLTVPAVQLQDEIHLDPVVLSLTVPPLTLQEQVTLDPVTIGLTVPPLTLVDEASLSPVVMGLTVPALQLEESLVLDPVVLTLTVPDVTIDTGEPMGMLIYDKIEIMGQSARDQAGRI